VIPGQSSSTLTTTEPGVYTVKAQVNAVCATGESNAITIIILSNEPSALGAGVTLSPNPTTGRLRVQASLASDERSVMLRVLDMQGKVMLRPETIPVQGQLDYMLDLSEQAVGSYFIELRTEKRVINRRVILVK
jgi:hypothetical protein